MRLRSPRLLLAALLLAAAPVGTACTGAGAPPGPRVDRTRLTRAELDRFEYANAYDAVFALRRIWLNERPQDRYNSTTPLFVYLDEMRMGGTDALRDIETSRIQEIRYYDGIQAYAKWGLGHDRGVIQVITIVPSARRP